MKPVHRIIAYIMVLCLFVGIAGCSNGKELTSMERQIRIEVIVKNRLNDFWTVVKMGAEAAGKEFGINVRINGPTDEKDIDGQIEMVRDAINTRADAIVLAASDYIMLVDIAEKAIAEKIPVIIIDSELKSNAMNSFVGTDNVGAGRKLGQALVEKIGEECSIAIMSFVKGAASCDQREEGLYEELERYPGIEVLAKEYCNSDEDLAESLTEEIINTYPNLDVIVCLNAYGTVGTARAIKKMNQAGKIKIIGFDSTPEEISCLEKGIIQSLVAQNPFSMGYLGVKYALDVINNEKVPKRVDTGSIVIDINNMYLPENQKLVFPFTD